MDIGEEIARMLKAAVRESGNDLKDDGKELAKFIGDAVKRLRAAKDDPHFDVILQAEIDNIRLRAALATVKEADKTDERITGILQGALNIIIKFVGGA